MITIPVVIGANFGDEGKGLMTDYLTNKALQYDVETNRNLHYVICIRHNGGAQAGHTVNYPDGRSFVFNSIPSGCGVGRNVIGYLGSNFYLNPLALLKELEKFKDFFGWTPIIMISPSCRIVTPWDMATNQIHETNRGSGRHGSCGHGIFECFKRSKSFKEEALRLKYINPTRIAKHRNYGLENLNEKSKGLFDVSLYCSSELLSLFTESLYKVKEFNDNSISEHQKVLLGEHFQIIVEGAQGLGLSEKLIGQPTWSPHLTPSDPGIESASEAINDLSGEIFKGNLTKSVEIQPIYVTRTYLTRHGTGQMYSSQSQDWVKFDDDTNKPNQWQGDQRRGKLDLGDMRIRICSDLFTTMSQKQTYWDPVLAVTWADSQDFNFPGDKISIPIRYISTGKTRQSVAERRSTVSSI
jgi:adenylosuccinate synthase